jgi:hypothetical protein
VRGLWIRALHRDKDNGIPGDAVKKLHVFPGVQRFFCVEFFLPHGRVCSLVEFLSSKQKDGEHK